MKEERDQARKERDTCTEQVAKSLRLAEGFEAHNKELLQREAARHGRQHTGRRVGRPRKRPVEEECSEMQPPPKRKGTPRTQRQVAWQEKVAALADEAVSSKKKLMSLYEQGPPEW